MNHLQLRLRTPKQSPRESPVEGSEENESSSTSTGLVHKSPFCAFVLAPRRNYEQELETRTMYVQPPKTEKMLAFPSLDSPASLSSEDDDDDNEDVETIPRFSLKRKRFNEEQDVIIVPSRPSKKLGNHRVLFRPIQPRRS